jgi:hypothetical protein
MPENLHPEATSAMEYIKPLSAPGHSSARKARDHGNLEEVCVDVYLPHINLLLTPVDVLEDKTKALMALAMIDGAPVLTCGD